MTEAELLTACRSRIDDDRPRHMLADWYDENGDSARAEFIRVQCEISTIAAYAPRVSSSRMSNGELVRREEKLIETNWPQWIVPIAEAAGVKLITGRLKMRRNINVFRNAVWTSSHGGVCHESFDTTKQRDQFVPTFTWEMSRGLIEKMSCLAADWVKFGPALWRISALKEVKLVDKHPRQIYTAHRAMGFSPPYRWALEDGVHDAESREYTIPDELTEEYWLDYGNFATEKLAKEALSEACLRYAASASS